MHHKAAQPTVCDMSGVPIGPHLESSIYFRHAYRNGGDLVCQSSTTTVRVPINVHHVDQDDFLFSGLRGTLFLRRPRPSSLSYASIHTYSGTTT